ncbi:hypothetical protein ACQ4PT_061901 [Festuca glaucescens]
MGDRGGRFNGNGGRRGGGGGGGGRKINAGRADQPNRNLVWQRDHDGAGGSNSSTGSERWDAAAAAAAAAVQGVGKEKSIAAQGGGNLRAGKPQVEQIPSLANASCLNCGSMNHFAARCPVIRCERCGKLGHINQVCQAILPWECVASMCAFQAQGQGFFYFPDSSSVRQVKDRASSLVITVIEGNPSFRDIKQEFTDYLGTSWRCTARPINATQYTMRFPNPKEVERACYFGKRMEMKTCDDVLSLSPWSAAIGASSMLNKAWVRVRNIPHEKRCDAHAAYARSLVGVTLEVDQATLYKSEYCRILLGCRDINKLPESAEGALGDFFYIFSYEVETIVAQGPPVVHNMVSVSNSSVPPSPKRPRTDFSSASAASSDGQTGAASQSVGTGFGKIHTQVLASIAENDSEEESEVDTELLIDVIARERRQIVETEKSVVACMVGVETPNASVVNASGNEMVSLTPDVPSIDKLMALIAPITPVVEKDNVFLDTSKASKQIISYVAIVARPRCSAAPVVTNLDYNEVVMNDGNDEYFVQSPSSAEKYDEIPSEKLVPPVESRSDSLRNPEGRMGSVLEQAAAISRRK